jgi:hypothetical protein
VNRLGDQDEPGRVRTILFPSFRSQAAGCQNGVAPMLLGQLLCRAIEGGTRNVCRLVLPLAASALVMVVCGNCERRDGRSSRLKPDFRVANQTAEQSDVIYIAHGIFSFWRDDYGVQRR